jgi:FPC/CPF motif-containing protein YcgG
VVVDLPVVSSAAVEDEVGALGPRAVWPVAFFADPEPDVAELSEFEAELWSVSSALATATTGPASDNPSARAAIPALAPR